MVCSYTNSLAADLHGLQLHKPFSAGFASVVFCGFFQLTLPSLGHLG